MPTPHKATTRAKRLKEPVTKAGIKKLKAIIGKDHGAQTIWARRNRVSTSHLNNILNGRRPLGEKMARILARY